jgi:hypothetical protein
MRINTHSLNTEFGSTTADTGGNLSTVGRHEFRERRFRDGDTFSNRHGWVVGSNIMEGPFLGLEATGRSP